MRWLDGITDFDGREFEWTPGVGDGQGGLMCCNSGGHTELDTTEWLNWIITDAEHIFMCFYWLCCLSFCYRASCELTWMLCILWRLITCWLYHLQMFFLIWFPLLCCAKAFKFNEPPFVDFCFYFHDCRRWIQNDIAVIHVRECSMFSSKSFIVSYLTFQSLIHFEFIFVYGVREYFNFILLHVAVQIS